MVILLLVLMAVCGIHVKALAIQLTYFVIVTVHR